MCFTSESEKSLTMTLTRQTFFGVTVNASSSLLSPVLGSGRSRTTGQVRPRPATTAARRALAAAVAAATAATAAAGATAGAGAGAGAAARAAAGAAAGVGAAVTTVTTAAAATTAPASERSTQHRRETNKQRSSPVKFTVLRFSRDVSLASP